MKTAKERRYGGILAWIEREMETAHDNGESSVLLTFGGNEIIKYLNSKGYKTVEMINLYDLGWVPHSKYIGSAGELKTEISW